jgi:MFS family permease
MSGRYAQGGSISASLSPHPAAVAPGDVALGVIIGRASEHFNFFIYAIASVLVFPAVFFPFLPQLEGMLYAFLILAFAFMARPFGTLAFMAIQRRSNREVKIILALFLLGASTAGIAFLPTYGQAGFAAIVLLALLRIGQGIAQGGSWDGLPALLALNAPPNRRGWYAMLGQLGAPIGFLLAAGLFSCLLLNLSKSDFLDWGWRYPFFVAFAINVVALFARLRLISTKEYARLLAERELEPAGIKDMARSQGRNILLGAMAALASTTLFHLVTVFPLSWLTLYAERPAVDFLLLQMAGAGLAACGVVASGILADRIGRRNTLGTMACLIAAFSGCIPALLDGGEAAHKVFILVGFGLLGLSYGQAAGAITANFPAKSRYTGAALASDLAWLAGAAFAPLAALGLSAYFGLEYVSLYLLSGALCTLAALSANRSLEIRHY